MSTRAGAWLGALVVALLATVPLLRELDAPYGRGMSGWQGAFFSIAAQRYEHNGLAAHAGYPSMQIAGAHISEDDLKRASKEEWVYANHPPTVPLLAWLSVRTFAPDNWYAVYPPRGTEAPLRVAFLALHALGAVCLWWLLRDVLGVPGAWFGAITYALLPVEWVLGMHPNYEHAVLVPLLLGLRAAWHHGARATRPLPWSVAGWMALGACITWSPLAFLPCLPWLWTHTPWRVRLLHVGFVSALAAVPLLVHMLWAGQLNLTEASSSARAGELLQPWLEGQGWLWLQALGNRAWDYQGVAAVVALCAVPMAVVAHRTRSARLILTLVVSCLLVLVAFARHVIEGQEIFQLMLAPAVAGGVAYVGAQLWTWGRVGRSCALALLVVLSLQGWVQGQRLRTELQAATWSQGLAPLPQDLGPVIRNTTEPHELVGVPARFLCELATAWHAWRDVVAVEEAEAEAWLAAGEARVHVVPLGDGREVRVQRRAP